MIVTHSGKLYTFNQESRSRIVQRVGLLRNRDCGHKKGGHVL